MAVIEAARTTHTTLESADVAKSLRFYREVMGLGVNLVTPLVGHIWDTNDQYAAVLHAAQPSPQPFHNFYARPLRDRAAVDAAYTRVAALANEHGLRELRAPAREERGRFGVDSYGFYLEDRDGNWWRVEDNAGPFGALALPKAAEPRGAAVAAGPIGYVTLESQSLDRSLRFYRDFLGLQVERPAAHYCLCRDRGVVRFIAVEVGDRLVPQKVSNHHGLTMAGGEAEIDEAHARALASADEFGLKRVLPATHQHGSYSFYLQDMDSNCWEIEVWEDGISPIARALRAAGRAPV